MTLTQDRLLVPIFLQRYTAIANKKTEVEDVLDRVGKAVGVNDKVEEVDTLVPTNIIQSIADLPDQFCRFIFRLDNVSFVELGKDTRVLLPSVGQSASCQFLSISPAEASLLVHCAPPALALKHSVPCPRLRVDPV